MNLLFIFCRYILGDFWWKLGDIFIFSSGNTDQTDKNRPFMGVKKMVLFFYWNIRKSTLNIEKMVLFLTLYIRKTGLIFQHLTFGKIGFFRHLTIKPWNRPCSWPLAQTRPNPNTLRKKYLFSLNVLYKRYWNKMTCISIVMLLNNNIYFIW